MFIEYQLIFNLYSLNINFIINPIFNIYNDKKKKKYNKWDIYT